MDAYLLLGGLLAFVLLDVLALLWGADSRETSPKRFRNERET